jgi:hypothetical protein
MIDVSSKKVGGAPTGKAPGGHVNGSVEGKKVSPPAPPKK